MKNTPKARQENLVIQELENEILIYDIKSNKCFCLNESLKLIWHLCDGKNSANEISNLMSQNFRTIVSENFILLGLRELYREDLLEKEGDLEFSFLKSSRRELIKNIGFASIITLPIISSVVVPSVAMAQSVTGLPLFADCSPTGAACRPGLSCQSSTNPFAPTIIAPRCCAGTSGFNYTSGVSHGCLAPGSCNVHSDKCCSRVIVEETSPSCVAGTVLCVCA